LLAFPGEAPSPCYHQYFSVTRSVHIDLAVHSS
jgi:hypothetical protein